MAEKRFEELVAKSMGAEVVAEEIPKTEEVKTEVPKEETKTETTSTSQQEEVKKEEVKEEVSKESSLKTGEESPKEEKNTPTEEEPITQQPSFDDLLSEKTDGQFKTYDELSEALSKGEETLKVEFANEQMAKLNEYVNKGGTMEDFLYSQTANYEEMDSVALVKRYMLQDNPELSSEEVNLLYDDTYKLDEDEYTDKEIRLSQVKLKQKAAQAKRELMKFQKDNALPEPARNAEEAQREAEANKKIWSGKVEKSLKDFKEINFELNDKGDEFTYAVPDDALKYVKKTSKNLPDFWNRYKNDDGTENITKLNKEIAILESIDSIVRNAYAQGKSGGKEAVIEDIKNPSYTPESKTDNDKPLSVQDQINKELMGR